MFTCNDSNRFLTRVLAGLMIAVTVVIGSLTHAVANMQSSNGQLQHVYVFPTELASDADYVPSEAFEKAAESPDRILVSEEDFNAALKLNALQSQLTFFDIVNKARKSFEELPEEKKEWLRKFVTPEQAEKIRKDVIEFARTAQESKQ